MSKKINLEIEKSINQELKKYKVIKLKIGQDEYEVRIKYKLTTDEKVDMMQKICDAMVEMGEDSAEMAAIALGILQTITDIEFSDDFDEKVKLFVLLSDGGYLATIFNSIPEKTMEEISDFLKTAIDLTPDMLKKMRIEQMGDEGKKDD